MKSRRLKLPKLRGSNPSQMIAYTKDLHIASSQRYQKSLNLTPNGLISPIKHPYKKKSSFFVSISQSSSPKTKKENTSGATSNLELPYLRKMHPGFQPSFKKKRMQSLRKKLNAEFTPYSIHGTSKSITDRKVSLLAPEEITEQKAPSIPIQKPSRITIFSRIMSVSD